MGYRKVDGKLVEEPVGARVIRRLFDLYLEMKSLSGVARLLNEEGVKTPRGKAWSGQQVKQILQNPVYTGANVYGRHKKGDTRLRPREEWTIIPGMREPIVAVEKYEAAQALLAAKRADRRACQPPQVYLLSGMVRCGKCGGPMCGSAQRRNGKLHRYYRCNVNQHSGRTVCSGTSVRADVLEERVLSQAREVASGLDRAEPVARKPDPEVKQRRAELDRIKGKMAKVFELYEMGQIGKGVFRERMAELAGERDALTATMADERREPPRPPSGSESQTLARELLREVTVFWVH